jgi:hypothetical protein
LLDLNFPSNNQTNETFLNNSFITQTIAISSLLEFNYCKIIGLPDDIKNTVIEINTKRNNIHFLTEWEFRLSESYIQKLENLKSFVDNRIKVVR